MVQTRGAARYKKAFLRGVEVAFDPTGSKLRVRLDGKLGRSRAKKVVRALASYWTAVGQDMRRATDRYGESHKK
jgi:hypothetical protein